jgi:large repetitive protein
VGGFSFCWGAAVSAAVSNSVSVRVRRFLAGTAAVCAFALVGSDLSPAAAAPVEKPPAQAAEEQTDTRPDPVSAQVTAKATGHRVEDTSQRSETSQVFANPDGTWTLESFTLPKFRETKGGQLEPIGETQVFDAAGRAYTGAGAKLTVSEGQAAGRDGVAPLVEMTGTGDDAGHEMVLGWEGDLPAPQLTDGQAVYDTGVTVPVASTTPSEPTVPSPEATPEPSASPSESAVPDSVPTEPTASPAPSTTPPADDETNGTAGTPAGDAAAEAKVVVEPTRTGFMHTVVLDEAPEGDVVLRFPLTFSKGLKAVLDKDDAEIRVVDGKGDLAFQAPTPLMWDTKINEASGLPAAETPVDTRLVEEDGRQVLILTAPAEWLQAEERQYPVTIDPSWSTASQSDTYAQSDSTVSNAGSPELRVGTFDGGTTKARSFLRFNTSDITGKQITKAEVRLNNYYSYSCNASEIKVQRLTQAFVASDVRWTAQPTATATGEGKKSDSKGYSSSCPGGYVYFPATAIAQYWADNPSANYGVRLIASTETSSYSWKRYRSTDYLSGGIDPVEPHLVVTYNSYPYTAYAPTFGSGQSSTYTSGSTTTTYVKTLKPEFRAIVSDPDKGNVRGKFTVVDSAGASVMTDVLGSSVPAGTTSILTSYTPSLVNGKTYKATARSYDGVLTSKNPSATTTFTVDTTAPTTPTVTTSNYQNNGWRQDPPSSNTFTFSTSSTDTAKFQYAKDGAATWSDLPATGTNPRTATLSWNPKGSHILKVRAVDKAGHASGINTFKFMNGLASLTGPKAGSTSSDTFRITAAAPPSSTGTVTPTVYWRPAATAGSIDASTYGSASSEHGWIAAQTLSAIPVDAPVSVNTVLDVATMPANALKNLGKERIPALIEIQVCFAYAGQTGAQAVQCSTNTANDPTTVTKLPHAFGNAFPTTEAGDGQAALSTGEFNLTETDVSIDAGNTGLSVSRTHSSYSGIGANSAILGTGWRANLQGPDEGLAGMLVADATGIDGTISLIGDDESTLIFRQKGNTKTPAKTGEYLPANEDATASGLKVDITGTGTEARINATEPDGTTTSFVKGARLEPGVEVWEWTPDTVTGTAATGETKFTRDSDGKITRITAGTETNLDCTTPVKGCRVLELAYETGSNRLSTVKYTAWDPEANGGSGAMATQEQTRYAYKAHGSQTVLASVKDSRSGDTSYYEYGADTLAGVPTIIRVEEKNAAGSLISAPVHYGYGSGPTTGGRADWLETVHKGDAATGSGKIQTARIVYGVPANGDGSALPKIDAATAKLWEQDAPAIGAAVFGIGKTINTSHAETLGLASADWKRAEITYWDGINRTTNTAFHGAGGWQYGATIYNEDNLPVREYTASAIGQIRTAAQASGALTPEGTLAGHEDFATITAYPTEEDLEGQEHAAHIRAFPTDVWGPVARNNDGNDSRVHTTTTYTSPSDLDAAGMPRMLPLTVTTTETPGGKQPTVTAKLETPEPVIGKTVNGYNAAGSEDKNHQRSGWVHGTPTSVSKDVGDGTTITTRTLLNEKGRTVGVLQPESNGSDAGTTTSIYYTAEAGTDSACGNKPEYAGYLCKTIPQGAGAVTEHQSAFNLYGQVTRTEETASGTSNVLRTTVQTYRADGQELTTTLTGNIAGSAPVQPTEKLYDSLGRHTGNRALAAHGKPQADTVWDLDLWGRTTKYTNSLGEATETTYNTIGKVGKVTTPHSVSTYWYGAWDSHGTTEYRYLPTKMTISNHGAAGSTATYTADYNTAGNITTQTMPAGLIQTRDYDSAGRPTTLTYSGPVTQPDGTTTTGTWISWTQARNTAGQVVAEATPDGILLGGLAPEGDPAADYEREYTYDQASRLTKVVDRTAAAGETINTDSTEGDLTPTTTRTYSFDQNGNRTSLVTSTEGGAKSTRTWTYDAADRIGTTDGYVYDGLGRQTTIPAADAPATETTSAGSGAITLGYYDDDRAHTITRNGATTTIGLDPDGRRLTLDGATRGKLTQHYTDASDNPAWTSLTLGSTTTTTRYETTLGDDLAVTITDGEAKLALNNPHGDTVATATLPATGNATGINAWAQYNEYGNQQSTPADTGTTTYGWHGADQRALENSGLILMGARLYNSATGHFTTRDPVTGGNTTTYTYPQDPVNMEDTSGLYGWVRQTWNNPWFQVGLTVASFIPVVGVAAWGYRAYRAVQIVRAIQKPAYRSYRAGWYAAGYRNGRSINRTFTSGSFGSSRSSFVYHYKKHGSNYGSPRKYHRAASRALPNYVNRASSGTKRYRGSPGGIMNHSSRRWASFW